MPKSRLLSPRPSSALIAAALAMVVLSGESSAAAGPGPAPESLFSLTFTGSYLAARSAIAQHDSEGAALYLGRALKSDPENPVLLEQTFIVRLANGEIDSSLPLAERLIQRKIDNAYARLAVGSRLMRDGNFQKARQTFKDPARGPVGDLVAAVLSAWAEQGAKNTDAALALIDGLKGPEWFDMFKAYHHGLIAELAGRQADALKSLKAAASAEGSPLRMSEAYARLASRTGDKAEAERVLAAFAERVGDHPLVAQLLADLRAGKPLGQMVKSPAEGASEAFHTLGAALANDNDNTQAIIFLEFAVYLDPSDDTAWLALGDLRQHEKDNAKAIAAFNHVAADSPLKTLAVTEAALSLDAIDKTDEAAAQINALLDKQASNALAATALGDIYRGRKRFGEAADAYSKGLAATPKPVKATWRLFYSRGISYERTDRWPLAEADFRKALELNPDQPQVLNYLGYSMVDKGVKLDEAMGMIQKAVELRPDDAYIVDSLGWALFKLGRIDDAVKELERAVQLQPEDPTINDHLGDAYWKVGRKLEAMFQWRHARDLDPDPADLPKIVKKLQSGLVSDAGKDG